MLGRASPVLIMGAQANRTQAMTTPAQGSEVVHRRLAARWGTMSGSMRSAGIMAAWGPMSGWTHAVRIMTAKTARG